MLSDWNVTLDGNESWLATTGTLEGNLTARNQCQVVNNSIVGDCSEVEGTAFRISVWDVLLALLLAFFILGIVIGNVFVILSVLLFREMRTLTNGLIISLATADLLVAIIVLPISLYQEVTGPIWTMGVFLCNFWITADVFCCTASILNIVAIAVDRYWLITLNVRYTHNTTFSRRRACLIMAFLAWLISSLISCIPLFGLGEGHKKTADGLCMISQDLVYTIFSTFGAFWVPLSVILIVYVKIFRIARRRAIVRAQARAVHPSLNSTALSEMNGRGTHMKLPRPSDSNSPQGSPSRALTLNGEARTRLNSREEETMHGGSGGGGRGSGSALSHRNRYRMRTRNSARTLGLIIGGFVICWLPFFILATVVPFCTTCSVPPVAGSLTLWLGYSNSLLNPAIYAIWDKNFRRSFRRLCHCDVRWTRLL